MGLQIAASRQWGSLLRRSSHPLLSVETKKNRGTGFDVNGSAMHSRLFGDLPRENRDMFRLKVREGKILARTEIQRQGSAGDFATVGPAGLRGGGESPAPWPPNPNPATLAKTEESSRVFTSGSFVVRWCGKFQRRLRCAA
ncbi:hypothetical protein CMUS01_04951 [Colletotrichum musicola]|uniref:Uncharacterized protein n=1 Tax=Colletotrichum musicola TaxID=2175873 RepID=A0A8H6KUS7_9PEZI|nr:hypothetical protein CMUS01_04951 [Colletotrichum musicola]